MPKYRCNNQRVAPHTGHGGFLMTAINTTTTNRITFNRSICNCCGVKSTIFRVDVDENGDGGSYTPESCNCSKFGDGFNSTSHFLGLGQITVHYHDGFMVEADYYLTDGDRLNVNYKGIELEFDEDKNLCNCNYKGMWIAPPEFCQYLRMLGYFVPETYES